MKIQTKKFLASLIFTSSLLPMFTFAEVVVNPNVNNGNSVSNVGSANLKKEVEKKVSNFCTNLETITAINNKRDIETITKQVASQIEKEGKTLLK